MTSTFIDLENTLKIGPALNTNHLTEAARGGADVARTSPSGTPTTSDAAVHLSELSARLAELEAKLSGTEAFDQKRIDEIKQAIAQGQFSVNPDAIADKLIENIREMLAGKKT